jgi:hypothetical protein
MVHELKVWTKYFDSLIDNSKTFEVRFDDRGYQVGDMLILKEFILSRGEYSGRMTSRKISYKLNAKEMPNVIAPGYCVLGFELPKICESCRSRQLFSQRAGITCVVCGK